MVRGVGRLPGTNVGASRISYEIRGTAGDPVVLVHGSLVDRHNWDAIVPALSQSLQVLTYDRRGHGESIGPLRPNPVRDDAHDLAGLLESLDFLPAHVVAHSYGGAVAFRLALERPELVRSIAVHEPTFVALLRADPASAPEADRLIQGVEALRARASAGDPEAAARGIVQAFSTQEGAWDRLPPEARAKFRANVGRWWEEFEDPEAWAPDFSAFPELLLPVLLSSGDLSPPFLGRITKALAQRLRNVVVCTLPDVGHVPQVTRPHQYVGLLMNFLLERNVPVT